MFQKRTYISISQIATDQVQFASGCHVTATPDGKPSKLIINIAIDGEKANGQLEMPVFMPAEGNYPSFQLNEMYRLFTNGDPFVAIKIENLEVFFKEENGLTGYIGFGTTFELVPDPLVFIEEEDLL